MPERTDRISSYRYIACLSLMWITELCCSSCFGVPTGCVTPRKRLWEEPTLESQPTDPKALNRQRAPSISHMYTLGPKIGIIYILGVLESWTLALLSCTHGAKLQRTPRNWNMHVGCKMLVFKFSQAVGWRMFMVQTCCLLLYVRSCPARATAYSKTRGRCKTAHRAFCAFFCCPLHLYPKLRNLVWDACP